MALTLVDDFAPVDGILFFIAVEAEFALDEANTHSPGGREGSNQSCAPKKSGLILICSRASTPYENHKSGSAAPAAANRL